MKKRKMPLTTREIVDINYKAWLACIEVQQWEKADIYEQHLKRLGYFVLYGGKTPSLQRVSKPRKNGLGERYLEAAQRLKWYDAGPRYGLTKRTNYLSAILFSVAWSIQEGNIDGLKVWLEKQIAWEQAHSMPAYKMLIHIQAHLLRNLQEHEK